MPKASAECCPDLYPFNIVLVLLAIPEAPFARVERPLTMPLLPASSSINFKESYKAEPVDADIDMLSSFALPAKSKTDIAFNRANSSRDNTFLRPSSLSSDNGSFFNALSSLSDIIFLGSYFPEKLTRSPVSDPIAENAVLNSAGSFFVMPVQTSDGISVQPPTPGDEAAIIASELSIYAFAIFLALLSFSTAFLASVFISESVLPSPSLLFSSCIFFRCSLR